MTYVVSLKRIFNKLFEYLVPANIKVLKLKFKAKLDYFGSILMKYQRKCHVLRMLDSFKATEQVHLINNDQKFSQRYNSNNL